MVVLLAAFNTGLNLLYLAFGAMAALLVLSIPAARAALAGASVDCRLPETAVAGQPFPVRIRVAGLGRFRIRSLMIHHGLPERPPLALDSLPPGGTQRIRWEVNLHRRGILELPGLVLESRHPLGLVSARRRYPGCGRILVVPAALPLQRTRLPDLMARGGRSRRSNRTPGDGLLFLGVREHRPEDGLRRIHWKSTARTGRLMVRELEREAPGPVALVIDPAPVGGDEEYETLVRAAATLSRQFLESGVPVRLVPSDPGAPVPEPAHGLEEMPDLLRWMARLDRRRAGRLRRLLHDLAPRLEPGENPVALVGRVTPESAADLADGLSARGRPRAFVLEHAPSASRLESLGVSATLLNADPASPSSHG